jgi:hypothetical protein
MTHTGPGAGAATIDDVKQLWPELDWIGNPDLRGKVARSWERAFELSPLTPAHLNSIPFTLLIPNCHTTFMEHKRCVVHSARHSAEAMQRFMVAGAIKGRVLS